LLGARGFGVDSDAPPMNGKSRFNHSNHTLHSDFQIGFEKKTNEPLIFTILFFKLKNKYARYDYYDQPSHSKGWSDHTCFPQPCKHCIRRYRNSSLAVLSVVSKQLGTHPMSQTCKLFFVACNEQHEAPQALPPYTLSQQVDYSA
jgi:hypothetical protein